MAKNSEKVVSRDKWCRHRTPFGSDHPVCKVGVDYHQYMGDYKNMPCLGENADARARCPQYSGYTDEEIAAHETEMNARFERLGIIRKAIIETGLRSGVIDCPACKTGKVGFSKASNGHVHARCSTEGCASWME